jgi:hypothetical protein
MNLVPPYLNKMEDKAKKELNNAEKKELKAKKHYEFAQEYTKLCKERLDKLNEKK